jgi:hypothetical protein
MTETVTAEKPGHLPDKFWDAKTGQIRTDALLKSYLQLEQKLSQGSANTPTAPETDEDRRTLFRLLGTPETAEDYCIDCSHGLFEPDRELNQKLFDLGFTGEQAQALYDTAAEKLVPLVLDVAAEFAADRELDRLVAHFGGAEKWQDVSRQLLTYGKRHLPGDVLASLASSYDGVLALYRMMEAGNPGLIKKGDGDEQTPDAKIAAMMRDPKYWRDRDPKMVAEVTKAFESLYG